MPVQLGTVAPVGFHDFPPEPWLACMRRLGCTVVQVYRNQQALVPRQEMLDAISVGRMPCDSLHGVFGEQFDPSAPQEEARRFAVQTYRAEGELAKELGGPLVVVHCATIRREGISAEERAVRLSQLKKTVADLGAYGSQAGVRYAFENLPGYHAIGSDVAELAHVLQEVGGPHVGLCFDTGHANMVCDPAAAIRQAGEQIIYVHLNDNGGHEDEHLMPTYGRLDLAALARSLHQVGYHGTLMLEVFYTVDRLTQFINAGGAERLKRIVDIANGLPG